MRIAVAGRMRLRREHILLVALLCFAATHGQAQSDATARRRVRLSTFALLGDTYTGLGGATNGLGGRNFSLTAGVDLGLANIRRFEISAEVRGTYPLSSGHVDGQRSVLAGLRGSRTIAGSTRHAVTPFVELLAGRGSIHYVDGGYPMPPLLYSYSTGNVYSAGGGLELRLTAALSFVAEAQFQRWATPVATAGHIASKQGSGGVVYRFGAGSKAR